MISEFVYICMLIIHCRRIPNDLVGVRNNNLVCMCA